MKNKIIKSLFFFICLSFICLVSCHLINASNEPNEKVDFGSISTIDLTDLVTGEDATHDCIYISKFNESEHWMQCIICNKIKDKHAHNLQTSGDGACATYLTTFCVDCGYSYTEYIDHEIHWYTQEELDKMNNGNYITNVNTYYHNKGNCSKCGITTVELRNGTWVNEFCIDEDGKRINCINRKKCKICHKDYSLLPNISHQSTQTEDGVHYRCLYCNKPIYNELFSEAIHDKSNGLHWTLQGIYQLVGETEWNRTTNLATWGPLYYVAFEKIGLANVTPLPNSWYNNPKYNTQGITSGLYLVKYDVYFRDGFQGTTYTRMNADNCFKNINGNPYEYAKTYSTAFNIYPDLENPSNLIATVHGNGDKSNYSNTAYINASCTDDYSDVVSFALYDDKNNVVIDYKTVDRVNDKFEIKMDFSEGNVEINENQKYYVYYKDRYDNISKKEINISYIDTKAPTFASSKNYLDGWAKNKKITFDCTDFGVGNNGVGNVYFAFNNKSDFKAIESNSPNVFNRTYNFIGDVYSDEGVTGAIYMKDTLNNINTEFVKISKLDNTAPTITNVTHTLDTDYPKAYLLITANDINTKLKASGSGVTGYAISNEKLDISQAEKLIYQESNNFTIDKNGTYYIYAKDLVGNISKPIEYTINDIKIGNISLYVKKQILDNNSAVLSNKELLDEYGINGSLYLFKFELINLDTNERFLSSCTNEGNKIDFSNLSSGKYSLTEIETSELFEPLEFNEFNMNDEIKLYKDSKSQNYILEIKRLYVKDKVVETISKSKLEKNETNSIVVMDAKAKDNLFIEK